MDAQAAPHLRIAIVSAESLAEGFAPNRFVSRFRSMLEARGHEVSVVGRDDGPYHAATALTRIARYIHVAIGSIQAMAASDVLVTRGHFAHFPWVEIARLRRKPVVHILNGWINDAPTTYSFSGLLRSLIAWSYRRQFRAAHSIVCVTQEIADHLRRFGSGYRIEMVGNTSDAAVFGTEGDAESGTYAIFPSSLAKWHGIGALLEAAADPRWPADLDLVIAGDGQQLPLVLEHAARNPRVRYLGLLKREELARWLRGARMGLCLIEPVAGREVKEVYPLKLLEMMSSGLPVIATSLPGQAEIVSHAKAGLLVPPGDVEALLAAVSSLHASPDRERMGAAAVAAMRERQEQQDSAARMERIIREAASGSVGR